MTAPQIYLLHENPEWATPLAETIRGHGLPVAAWDITDGIVRLDEPPPRGVYFSRMSASAHTRDHPLAAAYINAVLGWLEAAGRRVVNGSSALGLELSKARQYAALQRAGIVVPRTRVVVGVQHVTTATDGLTWPLIVKPNRGGKGLGVVRVDTPDELADYVRSDSFDAGPDGTILVQEYIEPAEPYIIRNEFAGGKFLYSVRVDTSGGFELCPADACEIDPLTGRPIGHEPGALEDEPPSNAPDPRFEILPEFTHPLHSRYEALIADAGIEICGIEMLQSKGGETFTYDINVNTNYNQQAETTAGLPNERRGMHRVAAYLGRLLEDVG